MNLAKQNKAILSAEKTVLDRVLKNMRGNDLLQIGKSDDPAYSESARVLRTFYLDANVQPTQQHRSLIQGHPDCLPIQSESIDIVLLVHQLDSAKNPLAILQEVHRVLRPNGRIVIMGFNRWSLWNCFHQTMRFHSEFFPTKIKRLLNSLDFEVTLHETFCFWPPSQFAEVLGQFCLPYAGAVSMLVATKNIPGVTPLVIHNFRSVRSCGVK